MLAFLFSLVVATTYPSCDAVDSCLGQVNGTLPLKRSIPTLANGGIGFTFTTSNCIDGTLAISDTCMCGTEMMWSSGGYPGYCYHGLTGPHSLYKHDYHFCANQFGLVKNTFSSLNYTGQFRCHCFDPATGIHELAHIGKPMCTNGFSYYEDCNLLDGTDANKALLAPYTGAKLEAIEKLFPSDHPDKYPACQCGEYAQCRAKTKLNPYAKPYCQYLAEVCSTVKECGVEAWQPEDLFDDDGCACGDVTCLHGEICEFQDKEGKMKHVCTWNDQSSEISALVQRSHAASGMAFIFALLVFICTIFACIVAIVTFCKAKKI